MYKCPILRIDRILEWSVTQSKQIVYIYRDASTWNRKYQELYDKAKTLIKKDACMKLFYDQNELLYIEIDTPGVGLESELQQIRQVINCSKDTTSDNSILSPIAFVSNNLSSADTAAAT